MHLALNEQHFDVTDTLTRRKEGYHHKLDRAVTGFSDEHTSSIHDLVLAKEEGLKDLLIEDWYIKRCLIDHFFSENVDFVSFRSGRFGEEGDFILEPYEYETKLEQTLPSSVEAISEVVPEKTSFSQTLPDPGTSVSEWDTISTKVAQNTPPANSIPAKFRSEIPTSSTTSSVLIDEEASSAVNEEARDIEQALVQRAACDESDRDEETAGQRVHRGPPPAEEVLLTFGGSDE